MTLLYCNNSIAFLGPSSTLVTREYYSLVAEALRPNGIHITHGMCSQFSVLHYAVFLLMCVFLCCRCVCSHVASNVRTYTYMYVRNAFI